MGERGWGRQRLACLRCDTPTDPSKLHTACCVCMYQLIHATHLGGALDRGGLDDGHEPFVLHGGVRGRLRHAAEEGEPGEGGVGWAAEGGGLGQVCI